MNTFIFGNQEQARAALATAYYGDEESLAIRQVVLFVQWVVWLVILVVGFATSPWPTLESVLEVFIGFYYPTVVMIVKLGIFKGEQNITAPILLGVRLGIFLYSIVFGVIASYYKRFRRLDNDRQKKTNGPQ